MIPYPQHSHNKPKYRVAVTHVIVPEDVIDKDMPSVQLADHEIGPVLTHYLDGLGQPTSDQTKGLSPVSHSLFQQWSQLVVQDGVLFRRIDSHALQIATGCPKSSERESTETVT